MIESFLLVLCVYLLSLFGGALHGVYNFALHEGSVRRGMQPSVKKDDMIPWQVCVFGGFLFLGLVSLLYLFVVFFVFFSDRWIEKLDGIMDRICGFLFFGDRGVTSSETLRDELERRKSWQD